jgi:hypothetical protein
MTAPRPVGVDAVTKTRKTDRKRYILRVLAEVAGTPVVLDELRWRVMRKELAEKKEPVTAMTGLDKVSGPVKMT